MRILLTIATTLVLTFTVSAPGKAETFRFAFQSDAASMDPYVVFETFTLGFTKNVYEPLVRYDANLELEPALATDWTRTDPVTWRFQLRQGVTFHNGNKFTARDVVFSYDRARAPAADLSAVVGNIQAVRALGTHVVEIETARPDPILPNKLPHWPIFDRTWSRAHDAAAPASFTDGGRNYATLHANGTGPFELVERQPDVRTVLTRNTDWWGLKNSSIPMERVVFRPMPEPSTRVAALLAGQVDMAYPVPVQQIDRVDARSDVRVIQRAELRTIFLGMDQARAQLRNGSAEGGNPFQDARVREAVYRAIDVAEIHKHVMHGASSPTGIMVAPSVNGAPANLNQRYAHDPGRARALLATAGYPDGFRVVLDCPNDRYVQDEAICEAIAGMLADVGIAVELNVASKSRIFPKILNRKTSFYLLGWTPATMDAFDVVRNLMMTPDAAPGAGQYNIGGYANARIDELGRRIPVELDPERRQAMLREAYRLHKADFGHIPLHQQHIAWGVRANATVQARPDNVLQLWHVDK